MDWRSIKYAIVRIFEAILAFFLSNTGIIISMFWPHIFDVLGLTELKFDGKIMQSGSTNFCYEREKQRGGEQWREGGKK